MVDNLLTPKTQSIFYNQHPKPIQRMLDFDYLCRRETPSIAAIVNPNSSGFHRAFFGSEEIIIPVYQSIYEAVEKHKNASVFINFASERSAFDVTVEALKNKQFEVIHIMAEGITENKTRELIRLSKEYGKLIIGPATVGIIRAGAFKTGQIAGKVENQIASKLYRPGSVGVVTKSGVMLNEMFNVIIRNSDGMAEGVDIGGDKFPVSTMLDHILRFETDPTIKMHVILGELGGTLEYEIVDALKAGKIKKPVVAWCSGTISKAFRIEVQFGHAGARAGADKETAQAKNKALKKAGAYVPKSYDDFGDLIKKVFEKEVKNKKGYKTPNDEAFNEVPIDFTEAAKSRGVRKPASIVSTISDDRGEEPTYNKKEVSAYADSSIGNVINALWFKSELSRIAEEFIELVIKLTADHGPAVSTAHNAIVTSRAGNNVVLALIAGLTTIGPRHGGAIDQAAEWILDGVERGVLPKEVLTEHKQKHALIMGIGHRIKSAQNPDKRVELLKKFAKKNLKDTKYLDFALQVEKETLKKKNNLILNVDGAVGAIFLDILSDSGFATEKIKEVISWGSLNALFALGRSIGIIGHAIDQKRLKENMYRHDWDDILYT